MERILVVDDEVEACKVLEEFLTLKGYEVYTAFDGPAAITKTIEVNPHIILLDIHMPGMGGIDVLKEIKKIDPSIGVIIATAVADHDIALKAIELGAFDYITKPLDLHYLETVVSVKLLDVLG